MRWLLLVLVAAVLGSASASYDSMAGDPAMEGVVAILTLLGFMFSIVLYFLPSIVGRKKKNFGSILVLNIFLGWTFIGWVVALAWAVKHETVD